MSNVQCLSVYGLAPPNGHQSHVAVAQGLAFVSAQRPVTSDGTPLVGASFDTQVRQVLDNLDLALRAAGSSREQLVQLRVYLSDLAQRDRFDQIYAEWIGPVHRPARSMVPAGQLGQGEALQIEAVGAAGSFSTGGI